MHRNAGCADIVVGRLHQSAYVILEMRASRLQLDEARGSVRRPSVVRVGWWGNKRRVFARLFRCTWCLWKSQRLILVEEHGACATPWVRKGAVQSGMGNTAECSITCKNNLSWTKFHGALHPAQQHLFRPRSYPPSAVCDSKRHHCQP